MSKQMYLKADSQSFEMSVKDVKNKLLSGIKGNKDETNISAAKIVLDDNITLVEGESELHD